MKSTAFFEAAGVGELVPREERAQQGSSAITGWCPKCEERAVPMSSGRCGFCSTTLVEPPSRPPDRLAELAEIAGAEHARAGALASKALEHAIRCGEAITEARGLLPVTEWKGWLERTVGIGHSHALLYQRLAQNADQLREAGVPSVNKARRYLQEHGLIADVAPLPTPEQKERVDILSQAGWPTNRIAERVGLNPKTVTAIRRGTHRGKRGRPAKPPFTDEMVERAADWLSRRFGSFDYPERVSADVRADAGNLLRFVFEIHEDPPR